jgi:flavorubredoxin
VLLENAMEQTLFETPGHQCIAFRVKDGQGRACRQALIRHGEHAALIDPLGSLVFGPLAMAVSRHVALSAIDYVFSAHEDEQAVTRLERWLVGTDTRIVASRDWIRLSGMRSQITDDVRRKRRFMLLGARGGQVPLGDSELRVLPALPAHSVGQPGIYDPVSRILFSGEIGASDLDRDGPCESFDGLLPWLIRRRPSYLQDSRGCREWALIARDLSPHMILPRIGAPIVGRQAVARFLSWLETAGARLGAAA